MLYKRMKAIGDLVVRHKPDVVFFQEVSQDIRDIFESFAWWKEYCYCKTLAGHDVLRLSKLPWSTDTNFQTLFDGSPTYRVTADIKPSPEAGAPPIRVATAQLERPNPPSSMHFRERYKQARHAIAELDRYDNVVFGGDMSWGDDSNMPFPLPTGWIDAWTVLRGRDYSDDLGWTYDAVWEVEATKFNGHVADYESMRKRSDRFVCKLKDYNLHSIRLIGDKRIGPQYKTKLADHTHVIHLPPSCHRRLVLTIVPK
ncbi:hypothetical protein PR202_gb20935 [Eleusine coracana subsp. coracana]|uniref:Endonuclease/exonuclease/phosphatase domain-containing protein n=1 Tax=Eleusine coracana subsp. coracana TaxID=191504 RepID=A0AAV5FBX6_ELECO|nr:hypothetical protein PR202_gb20935 [Eleusine coracana subsp. coracana]